MATQFKVGDKVIYCGKWNNNGWNLGDIYTVKKIITSPNGNYVYPEEVDFGNDIENNFILVHFNQKPTSNLCIDDHMTVNKSHECEYKNMGFMFNKFVCVTCDKEKPL